MGYLTEYTLSIHTPGVDGPGVLSIFKQLKEYSEEAAYCLCDDGSTKQSGKWYDHEEDMLDLSKDYPNLIFLLEGSGEDEADLWRKFFKNGDMVVNKAEVTWREDNLTSLK
jgi:hypothetical protein